MSNARKGMPSGSKLTCGRNFLDELEQSSDCAHLMDDMNKCHKHFNARQGSGSEFVKAARTMHTNPSLFCEKRNFDHLVNWANKFHLLQPIRFGEVMT